MTGLAILICLVAAGFCLVACARRQWKLRMVIVETLRFALIAAAAFLLTQPESVFPQEDSSAEQLVVLVDQSGSMQTSDVVTDTMTMQTRSEAAEALLSDSRWKGVGKRHRRLNVSFSELEPSQTDLGGAIESTWSAYPEASAIVIVTDGDWNIGRSPVEVAAEFGVQKREYQRLICVGVGQEQTLPDVAIVSASIPTIAVVGKSVRIPVRVRNSMQEQRELTVNLLSQGRPVEQKKITVEPSAVAEMVFDWQTEVPGDSEVRVVLDPVDGEVIPSNNVVFGNVNAREEKLKVLVIESQPRWEFRYLRNALIRDPGVEVDCLLLHPQLSRVGGGGEGYLKEMPREPAELAKYDVVFLGDVGVDMRGEGKGLTAEDCDRIAGLVREQAVGLVFIPGPLGRQSTLAETALDELFPVEMDASDPGGVGTELPSAFSLTSAGRSSLLMELEDQNERNWKRWAELPGFYWHAPVVRSTTGARVLAVHSESSNRYGRLPLLVTRPFGAGKVLFMGTDGAWRWRQGVEDRYHYRFWGQVIRWMAYQRNMAVGSRMRLSYFPERPEAGQTVSYRVAVVAEDGEPLRRETFSIKVAAPDGSDSVIDLKATDQQWGVYVGQQTLPMTGDYGVTVSHPTDGSQLDVVVSVQGKELEQIGKPARPDVLRAVARSSGGSYFDTRDLAGMFRAVEELPPAPDKVNRVQWWNQPWLVMLMVAGWGLLWVGRKWAGLV